MGLRAEFSNMFLITSHLHLRVSSYLCYGATALLIQITDIILEDSCRGLSVGKLKLIPFYSELQSLETSSQRLRRHYKNLILTQFNI